jgi:hypothetical protein
MASQMRNKAPHACDPCPSPVVTFPLVSCRTDCNRNGSCALPEPGPSRTLLEAIPETSRTGLARHRYLMRIPWIAIWTCATCLSAPAAASGTLQFVTNTVELAITSELFGAPVTHFPDATLMKRVTKVRDLDAPLDWYQTLESAAYERKHPRRVLRYGFQDGRLAAVYLHAGFEPEFLRLALEEFRKLAGENPTCEDEHFKVRYTACCSPNENHIAEILILPSDYATPP